MEQGIEVSKSPAGSVAHGFLSVQRDLGAPLNNPHFTEEEIEQRDGVAKVTQ